jgi:hypothetical protein
VSKLVDEIAKLSASAKGALVLAFVAVGGVGVGAGHWSGAAASPEARPVVLTSSAALAASASASARPAPMQFQVEEDPNWKAGVPLREMDRDIFGQMRSESLERTSLPDLFPDRPYRVRLIGSVAERQFGRVLIDFDRDEKWDERWELRPGEVRRFVEHDPTAGNQQVEYTLVHGKWQPH